MNYFAGIDLGGTKIYSLVIDENGKILSRFKMKTIKDSGFNQILESIVECYKTAVKMSGIEEEKINAVGIGVPSSVNIEKKVLIYAPNLGWKNVDLARILSEKINKPVFMDNDVKLAMFGEYFFGVGKGFKYIYGIFIGTGIGGGYIIDGNIIRGLNFTAGEIGHMIVKIGGPKCNCGKRGCLEAIAGKVGIINYMKKLTSKKNQKTVLDEISPDWKKNVGSAALKKSYYKNDKIVIKAIKRSAKTIGISAANLVNTIGIEAIILGGGLIEEMEDIFIPIIKEYMLKYSISDGAKGVNLLSSKLGDDAVALGAAWFVSQKNNEKLLYTKNSKNIEKVKN